MKKIIFSIFALALVVLGLVACGEEKEPTPEADKTDRSVVLADTEKNITYHVTGQYFDWGNACKEDSLMKAAKISDLPQALADKLAKKDVKYLYVFEGLEAGTEKTWTSWTSKAQKGGEVVTLNGTYAVKAIKVKETVIDDESKFTASVWMPDTNDKFHAEALTPEVLWLTPNYAEAQDEQGFHWDMNPMLIGGAGEYTIILAIYGSGEKDYAGGFGAIKTKDLQEYVEDVYEVPADATASVIGVIGGVEDWTNDKADMVKGEDGKYSVELDLLANDQLKVRINHSWDHNFPADNVKVETAGKYKVVFNPSDFSVTLVPAN